MTADECTRLKNQSVNDRGLLASLTGINGMFAGYLGLELPPPAPKPKTYEGKRKDWERRQEMATRIKHAKVEHPLTLHDGLQEALDAERELLKPHPDCDSDYCPWHGRGDD